MGMACLSPRLSSAPAQISVLATYLRLAGDRVWSVRQACAQVGCCGVSCAQALLDADRACCTWPCHVKKSNTGPPSCPGGRPRAWALLPAAPCLIVVYLNSCLQARPAPQ